MLIWNQMKCNSFIGWNITQSLKCWQIFNDTEKHSLHIKFVYGAPGWLSW